MKIFCVYGNTQGNYGQRSMIVAEDEGEALNKFRKAFGIKDGVAVTVECFQNLEGMLLI